jgi:hypothetical protein
MDTELLIIVCSAIAIFMGAMQLEKSNHLLATGKKADAVIFSNVFKSNRRAGFPVVRFLTDKKEWITQELSIGYYPVKEEGTKLEVIYDPANPTIVEINVPFQMKILPRLFLAIGITGFIFGMLEYTELINLLPFK